MKSAAPILFLAGFVAASGAWAEVRETRPDSFVVESSVSTPASPAVAFAAIGKVAAWWDAAHTWSGSARNLRLELRAGGCFCEKLGVGGSVEHGRVVFAQPGKVLRLEAALGPLQQMAVKGVLTFTFEPASGGTRITMSYRVAGAFTMDSARLAPGVDQVMSGQLERLRAFLETGKSAR